MNGVIFYTSGTLSCIFFTKLATEWKKIMLKWQEVDRAMVSYGWPKNLDRRLKIISVIFLLLEAAEHFSIQANKLIVAIQCKHSISKGFEHFSVNMSFPTIFHIIEPYYSAWLGVFLQCVNTRMAFSWTFIDLFIILISCALATRFKQVNNRVRCMKDMKIKRFMDSVKYQNPGLTGKSLFRITKRLILQITSAVVTYELVVIQFSKNWSKEDQPSKNSRSEHFSIQANKLIVAVECRGSISKGFEHFSVNMSFPVIFDVIKPFYSAWLGILLQCVNTRMAFSWTFIDLFIILISCALAMRFRQLNNRVRCMKDMKVQSERCWGSVNEDYNRLCNLCAFLDDKMSYLILVSFFNNFYFIIFQVFDSLSLHRATPLEIIYYFISLGLLILRMATICLYGSWINEESKVSVDLLSSTHHEIYNKEIKRFIESIKYQNAGLTGKKLFRITKQLILKITSAVVTYELVVIQFSKNWSKNDQPSKNSMC
ncbi:uncharacterized protein [Tenebrio molitor]|uniref:uncharacterized protein n=1 Tax=Tenebrio molitor TaxID=7067 RepID=UPI0036247520